MDYTNINRTLLKIDYKSISNEIVLLRNEEEKLRRQAKWKKKAQKALVGERMDLSREKLYSHRKNVVSRQARMMHIVRTFLRGQPYVAAEQKVYHNRVNVPYSRYQDNNYNRFWEEIHEMITNYQDVTYNQLKEWRDQNPAISDTGYPTVFSKARVRVKQLPRSREENKARFEKYLQSRNKDAA